MPEVAGRTMLLKIGDGGTPTEVFTTLGALRARRVVINNSEVPVTSGDSEGHAKSLPTASTKSYSVTGDGIFDDGTALERLRTIAETEADGAGAGPSANFELIDGTGDKYAGEMQVSNFELGGDHESALDYSVTLTAVHKLPRTAV